MLQHILALLGKLVRRQQRRHWTTPTFLRSAWPSRQHLTALPDQYRLDLLGENILTSQILLVQPLWTGGKIRYRHKQALLGVNAADKDLVKTQQETTFNVSRAYLAVVLAEELASVAQDTAGRFHAIESLVSSLVNAGNRFVTPADVHRVASLRLLAEANQVGLSMSRERALTALRLAMGFDQHTELLIADQHLVVGRVDLDPDVLLEVASLRVPS